jgi:CPA2 family monovalent cation:H+ antiporter-2
VLAVKVAGAAVSPRLLGYGAGTTFFASLLIAQVGEFSFVLERSGREMGLSPGGLAGVGSQALLAATVLLMTVTALLASLGRRLQGRPLSAGAPAAGAPAGTSGEGVGAVPALADHVLVAGFGPGGRELARALADRGVAVLVLTLSPDGAREAERMGLPGGRRPSPARPQTAKRCGSPRPSGAAPAARIPASPAPSAWRRRSAPSASRSATPGSTCGSA